jgi:hypothetical protein
VKKLLGECIPDEVVMINGVFRRVAWKVDDVVVCESLATPPTHHTHWATELGEIATGK